MNHPQINEDGARAASPQSQSNALTESDLSLMDEDYAQRIRDILAAKYGTIAVSEPILHTAVANAAALEVVSTQLKKLMATQRDGVLEDYQSIRDDVTNTLLLFEKNLLTIVQTATSEVCMAHIEQFRTISEKQTAQIEYIMTHGIEQARPLPPTPTPLESFGKPWVYMAVGALVSSIVSLSLVALLM